MKESNTTKHPLRFASIVTASAHCNEDMDMHMDDSLNLERSNVLVYLTDVKDNDGALEFETGPVLGLAGTAIHFSGNIMHRGTANKGKKERNILVKTGMKIIIKNTFCSYFLFFDK